MKINNLFKMKLRRQIRKRISNHVETKMIDAFINIKKQQNCIREKNDYGTTRERANRNLIDWLELGLIVLGEPMELMLANKQNYVLSPFGKASSNFMDIIYIGKHVNEYNAVGVISHDLLHLACFQIGENPFWHLFKDEEGSEYRNDPYRQCVKGCLGQ